MLQSHCGNDDSRRKTAISYYTRKIKGRSQVTNFSLVLFRKTDVMAEFLRHILHDGTTSLDDRNMRSTLYSHEVVD